jgi:protease I
MLAPGGWAPDKIRRDPAALELVRQVNAAGGLVATICHGPWVLISAGIVKGRRMTSTVGIRDDVVNAGATWVDEPVVEDRNLISSRVSKERPSLVAGSIYAPFRLTSVRIV